MKTPVSQNKKRPRQQEAVHNTPEEISQAQAQWQAEQLQFYTRRARDCSNADEAHTLFREAWASQHSVPKVVSTVIRILRERFIGPGKTPDNPHHSSLEGSVNYSNISIIAPMGPHDTPRSRRLNSKLYYVLRWFLYTRSLPRDLFSIKAKSPALPHGGQCLRSQCTESPEAFLDSAAFQELVRMLKAEQLTPCLYLFYGYSDGHDQKMTTIDITGYKHRKFLHRSDLKPGKRLECCNVPGFARWAKKKALENMKEKPVQEIEESESDYRAHFGRPS